MKKHRIALVLLMAIFLLIACSRRVPENVPSDFYMMMDVRDADHDTARNVSLRIRADGNVDYDIYETGGVIHYDESDIVTYAESQIIQRGKLRLTAAQMEALWKAVGDANFFELSDNYQMQIGTSYAFILIEANDKRHTVDNIGMEVPALRSLVETIAGMLPADITVEYGDGYIP